MVEEVVIERVSSGYIKILEASIKTTPRIEILNKVFRKKFSILFVSIAASI